MNPTIFVVVAAMGLPASSMAEDPGCPGRPATAYQPLTFFGYDCASDCGPEKAGFAWAERNGITTPQSCLGAEAARQNGCLAFVAERLTPAEAGYAWALENEAANPLLCLGGGAGFRRGCQEYVAETPLRRGLACAEAWPCCAEACPAPTTGR